MGSPGRGSTLGATALAVGTLAIVACGSSGSSSGSAVAMATVARSHGATRVAIPASVLPSGTGMFVKVERRFGFFDEAGWRLILSHRARPGARGIPRSIYAAELWDGAAESGGVSAAPGARR